MTTPGEHGSEAPINLNRARKRLAREAARRRADERAVLHGRTKAEREAHAAEAERRRHAPRRPQA